MSSASVPKLFFGVCSVFKCSFDEIVGEKVVSPSYSFVILGPPLEKTLESPLECKEIKPVNPKGNQPWIFIGTTDAEAEAPILWPPDAKSWLTGRDLDVKKDRRQEGRGTTENEMVLWHHQFNGHEFQQVLGDDEGQGNLVCCSPSGQSQTVELLNKNYKYTCVCVCVCVCVYVYISILLSQFVPPPAQY